MYVCVCVLLVVFVSACFLVMLDVLSFVSFFVDDVHEPQRARWPDQSVKKAGWTPGRRALIIQAAQRKRNVKPDVLQIGISPSQNRVCEPPLEHFLAVFPFVFSVLSAEKALSSGTF